MELIWNKPATFDLENVLYSFSLSIGTVMKGALHPHSAVPSDQNMLVEDFQSFRLSHTGWFTSYYEQKCCAASLLHGAEYDLESYPQHFFFVISKYLKPHYPYGVLVNKARRLNKKRPIAALFVWRNQTLGQSISAFKVLIWFEFLQPVIII